MLLVVAVQNDEPVFTLRSLHTAPVPSTTGMNGAVAGIVASMEEVGIIPQSQFAGSNQSVLTTPIHEPAFRIVIVNVSVVPVHPLADGVTTMVLVVSPVLVGVNELILPVPLAAKPMPVFVFVHVYVVPVTGPLKFIAEMTEPSHV